MKDKKISQYTLEGQYLRTYKSLGEAARKVGGGKSNISASALGKKTSSDGFLWRYGNSQDDLVLFKPIPKVRRKVSQYTFDGKYLKTYLSCADAERHVPGTTRNNIWVCAKGARYSHKGFLWRFSESTLDLKEVTSCQHCGIKINGDERVMISIKCLRQLKGIPI